MKDAKNLLTPISHYKEFSSLIKKSTEGLKQYNLLITAWDIGLFDHTINPKTSLELTQILGCSEAMIQMFCDALVDIGLLDKTNKTYKNSPMANNFLCHSSSYNMANKLEIIRENINQWNQLPRILKNGPIIGTYNEFFSETRLNSIAEWAEASSIANTVKAVNASLDVQRWSRLIDLGGGHGLFAIAFAALNPRLEAFVFDLPNILQVAERYIKEYKAERVHTFPGDYFKDDIGHNYDVIFSSLNPTCYNPTLIPKMVQALKPGGDLVIRRFKDSFREGAMETLDWNLLTWEGKKVGGKPRTADNFLDRRDYVRHLKLAGLKVIDTFSVDEVSEVIVACKSK